MLAPLALRSSFLGNEIEEGAERFGVELLAATVLFWRRVAHGRFPALEPIAIDTLVFAVAARAAAGIPGVERVGVLRACLRFLD